jgi:hypothetical protein
LSRSKQKGTLAETAVVNYLRQFWPSVERRALSGAKDKGDVAGIPNVVIEIKNHASYKLTEWIKETEVERNNAQASVGILVIKPKGIGVSQVNKWYAVVPLETMVTLLNGERSAEGLLTSTDQGNFNLRDLS